MPQSSPKRRNISFENLKEIFEFINNFKPKDVQEERNLAILKYAYEKNMSAQTIYDLNDPRMISYSNLNYGKKISATSIRMIIKSYNLEHEKRIDYSKRKLYKRRNEYANYIQQGKINREKICACCGSKKNIELHHIIPISLGGKDVYYNLVYLCHSCHVLMHRMLEEKFGEKWIDEENKKRRKKWAVWEWDQDKRKK